MKKILLVMAMLFSTSTFAAINSVEQGKGIEVKDSFGPDAKISLGNLFVGGDWEITGGGGITLSSPFASFKLNDADGWFHGALRSGDLSADRFWTFPDATGIVALTTSEISPKIIHFVLVDIPQADLAGAVQCTTGEEKIDTGGATIERCNCLFSPGIWYCTPMTKGPID